MKATSYPSKTPKSHSQAPSNHTTACSPCSFQRGKRDTFLFPCQTGYAKNTCQPSGKAWLHTATQHGANYFTAVKIGWIKTQGEALIFRVFFKPSQRTGKLLKLPHRQTTAANHKQMHSTSLERKSHIAPALQSGVH